MSADVLAVVQSLFTSEFALACAFAALTATLVALCVPGTIIPVSVSSGALLGGVVGGAAVLAGVLVGSQVLFLASRHLLRERVRARWGERLARFEDHFARRGFLYVVGLRVAGVPHFLVTAGSALSPVRSRTFLAATLLGFLPVIGLTSTAGSLF
ncbi:VTT domain-containing protein [Croceibacterium aestuarii]|uniref:VTT domain-containing protein n=1 Tax=Croceibacterium aestuarii TaxID=3064139 RepID=UPI00272DED60|nr:VTT domain-containing protein [Croceibacterium sp. D39]